MGPVRGAGAAAMRGRAGRLRAACRVIREAPVGTTDVAALREKCRDACRRAERRRRLPWTIRQWGELLAFAWPAESRELPPPVLPTRVLNGAGLVLVYRARNAAGLALRHSRDLIQNVAERDHLPARQMREPPRVGRPRGS